MVSSLNKDNNGRDQVQDGRYEGSEEVLRGVERKGGSQHPELPGPSQLPGPLLSLPLSHTPRPVDDLYLGVQIAHVDDKEDSSKDHLDHRQGGVSWCGGTEADQNYQAQYLEGNDRGKGPPPQSAPRAEGTGLNWRSQIPVMPTRTGKVTDINS